MAEPDWYTKTNRARLAVRRDLADALDDYASWLAGTHMDKPGEGHHEAQGEHADISRTLTNALNASGLPPTAAAGVAELGGYVNEGVTGGLQALLAGSDIVKGRPVRHRVLGPAGWDQADVEENRKGQMQAIREGDKRPEWMRAAAALQGAAARFAPSMFPVGVLENASVEAPRMAELGMRALDYASDLRDRWGKR